MHKKSSILFALLIVASLVLAACPAPAAAPGSGSGESSSESAADGGGEMAAEGAVTLNLNAGTEPPSLDPSLGTDTTSIGIINEMFLGLTELDPENQEATPELATDWSVSDDGLTWTFNLRDDVPWVIYQDGAVVETGDMVTAGDVMYGLMRTCDAATASDYAYVLYVVAGCEEANTTESGADIVAVAAPDNTTLEVTLAYPASYFPQIASMWIMRPMPQAAIEEHGDLWTEPGNMPTNGPYTLAEWIHGDTLQQVKNPFWYGWDELDYVGNIDVIDWVMIEEASTAFALYETDDLDSVGVPLEQMDRANGGEFGDEFVNTPRNCTYYYGFVTEKEAVSDVRVRKALSMAIDRKTLADDILKGGQIPANTFTNPLNFGSPAEDTDIAPWALSPEQGGLGYDAAIEMGLGLLEEAGYPNGDGLEITIGHNTSESHAKIAQAIQAMFSQSYPGISVDIASQEWGVYLDSLDAAAPLESKPDLYRLGWCQDYPHANNWIHEVFHPEQGGNEPLISADDEQTGEFVAAFAETTVAAQTAAAEDQLALYKEAERLFVDEIVGIAPIYYYTRNVVTKPWVDRVFSDDLYLHRWSVDMSAK